MFRHFSVIFLHQKTTLKSPITNTTRNINEKIIRLRRVCSSGSSRYPEILELPNA